MAAQKSILKNKSLETVSEENQPQPHFLSNSGTTSKTAQNILAATSNEEGVTRDPETT